MCHPSASGPNGFKIHKSFLMIGYRFSFSFLNKKRRRVLIISVVHARPTRMFFLFVGGYQTCVYLALTIIGFWYLNFPAVPFVEPGEKKGSLLSFIFCIFCVYFEDRFREKGWNCHMCYMVQHFLGFATSVRCHAALRAAGPKSREDGKVSSMSSEPTADDPSSASLPAKRFLFSASLLAVHARRSSFDALFGFPFFFRHVQLTKCWCCYGAINTGPILRVPAASPRLRDPIGDDNRNQRRMS